MRLQQLAKDAESGMNGCPTVYLAEDGSMVVQGHLLDADTEANLANVLAGEGAVRIRSEIVVETIRRYREHRPVTADLLPPGSARFRAEFDIFRVSVFRLETLQVYRDSGEDEALAAFAAGATEPPDADADAWEQMIRGHVRVGRAVQRVHVVTEPISDYLRFELTWAYGRNARAGEDIRIIPVGEGAGWPPEVPPLGTDYWLFDDEHLFHQHYAADGRWLGTEPVHDDDRVRDARSWRDTTLRLGVPWRQYLRRHPDLVKYLSPDAISP